MNFKSFRLMNVELNTVNQEKEENDKTSLRVNAGTSDINEDGEGQLEIEFNIFEKEEGYSREIKIKVLGIFEFPNKKNNNEYNLDEILKINGTAILMPYIRTLLSSLTSFDDSTEHILLPALNVKSMFEQSESE
ncbi:protein-export chaperone SecB [Staphylococcus epidermidis]|uniref:protein-export chaperone SecB n=2 Tax=Bacillota TaxID=1239 RepID=UPI00138AC32D|nr:protein-export chaperone SecB [Staphylococcus epidermidis]MBG3866489.1 protein-export chaperone SecB [Staphylococcus epidermidis]MCG1809145.1 protein-export chaperone SecB [Staphylococcus epidermidis]